MRTLLIYPQYPDTFWSFKHALKFIHKKAAFPPLGLLTIASMLPKSRSRSSVSRNRMLGAPSGAGRGVFVGDDGVAVAGGV